MAINGFLFASILISCLAATCYGITFSSLQRTLDVTASPQSGQVLKAGEDNITVTWSVNTSFPAGTDSSYKTVKVKLCYAPISQKDRGWRKTVDIMKKDKTCQHLIVSRPYTSSNNTITYTVKRDVPTATYFIRAYVFNAAAEEVGYGQTTDAHKTTNLFSVDAVSGRHVSLDIASVCFSAFSIVSLFGFFFLEKRKSKALAAK
ncbi:high-affinity nitrate transporter 3.1-like [Salvia miltiorrhiza]|uniref:high-affinity nitrate transporter 3.1-like n=1 Tax=Salvia miltiorrhiza TaxID=226208 RepID=UPI0025AB7C2C|nr:high-affinity nitrate transporter 3.1-like [Salvia miltiorrhiza]